MPGVGGARKGHEGTHPGRDLGLVVLEVGLRTEEPKATASGILRPAGVEIDEQGDQLVLAVGVDAPVLGPRLAAPG